MVTLAEMNYSLEPIQPLRIHYLRQHGYMAMPRYHAHDCYEIFYVQSGERKYVINNEMYYACAGDLVLIRPDDVHRTVSTEALQCERILVHFGEDFVMQGSGLQFSLMELGKHPIFSLPLNERKQVEQCLQTLLSEMKLMKPGYVELSRCLLITLLIVLYRVRTKEQKMSPKWNDIARYEAASVISIANVDTMIHIEQQVTNIDIEQQAMKATSADNVHAAQHVVVQCPSLHPMEAQMGEIVNYIRQHYAAPLSLSELARQFYISPAYLCRIFPRITGLHFRAFVQSIRLQEACRLLVDSSLSIGMIAERTGYTHTSNFSVIFKKMIGCTPSQYRRQKQENAQELSVSTNENGSF
ncbi:AraC family transcriptional regulator [Paenibacillus sp. WLX2291]|uniref:AraC family transcriptional regulator n=1 Tax=Paenibacillus sp. WLX2291 TaxID=3296934 RepID=UPI0039840E79